MTMTYLYYSCYSLQKLSEFARHIAKNRTFNTAKIHLATKYQINNHLYFQLSLSNMHFKIFFK